MHTLVFLQDPPYPTGFFLCDLCHERGSGSVLHCSACHFDLHPSCIATSKHASHFSHFKHPLRFQILERDIMRLCDGCGDPVFNSVYQCSTCNYDMHPHCARSSRYILHPSHKHPLRLISKADAYSSTCWCDGCGEEAERLIYHCSACSYDLHINCAMTPRYPLHIKHPEHRLELIYKPEKKAKRAVCSHCGKEASKWIYGCDACGFYMHVHCANIPGHVFTAPVVSRSQSPETSRDVDAVVKMMDKLLQSSVGMVSSSEAKAVRKVKQMLEEQQQGGPVTVTSAAVNVSKDGADQQTCAACFDDYESTMQRKNLKCGHHFHTGCILKWMDSSSQCPICRQQVVIMETNEH